MFESLSTNGVVAAALIAPPGADVLTALAGVDVNSLPESVQVDLLIALDRQSAWLAAQLQPVLAAAGNAAAAAARAIRDATDPLDLAERAAHAEIGAALHLHDNKAAGVLETARTLTFDLPAVHAALAAGEISFEHAPRMRCANRPARRGSRQGPHRPVQARHAQVPGGLGCAP